jgi:hypothetical protein
MNSRVRFPAQTWGIFLEGEDSHGDHDLGSLVKFRSRPLLVLHMHVSPSASSRKRNCTSWASQPQKTVTLRPQTGGETTTSIRDVVALGKIYFAEEWEVCYINCQCVSFSSLQLVSVTKDHKHNISRINPLPVQFKSLLPGEEGCVFFSGHLNTRTCHYVLLR